MPYHHHHHAVVVTDDEKTGMHVDCEFVWQIKRTTLLRLTTVLVLMGWRRPLKRLSDNFRSPALKRNLASRPPVGGMCQF